LRDYAWDNGHSDGRTHGVGEKKPNGFGLFDMHGNVYEWCADWYAADYYAASPVDDPQGPASGSIRVNRGGGWNIGSPLHRSASRITSFRPDYRYFVLGFRLALVPVDE
jgi:formylglycine-generating enzyme required for sulfatase activity